MRIACLRAPLIGAGFAALLASTRAEPPFSGTIFIDPDIVTAADPTCFESLTAAGRGMRVMFDRRVNDWVNRNAFLFEARFDDGLRIEVQVNPEFGTEDAARAEALRFMHATGQLPHALRREVRTMWLHKGLQPFGGGNQNLLIHSEQADAYVRDGILEETLQHEACHTSLDAAHAQAAGWLAAQQADGEFISTYARDHPGREDIAESFVPYFAFRHRRDRIDDSLAEAISRTIPQRIAYFDSLKLNLYPAVGGELAIRSWDYDPKEKSLTIGWSSRPARSYSVETSSSLPAWRTLAGGLAGVAGETQHRIGPEDLASPAFFRIRQE
jgi:hypothetical protein